MKVGALIVLYACYMKLYNAVATRQQARYKIASPAKQLYGKYLQHRPNSLTSSGYLLQEYDGPLVAALLFLAVIGPVTATPDVVTSVMRSAGMKNSRDGVGVGKSSVCRQHAHIGADSSSAEGSSESVHIAVLEYDNGKTNASTYMMEV